MTVELNLFKNRLIKGDDLTRDETISRKKDKKLKKELKKQKKLEKLANSNSSFPEDTQNETAHSPEKSSITNINTSSQAENASRAEEEPQTEDNQNLDENSQAAKNPQLSLKISKGNLVKNSANVRANLQYSTVHLH